MRYRICDLETTIRNEIGTNKGSAHCKENKIVLFGLKDSDSALCDIVNVFGSTRTDQGFPPSTYEGVDLLIGHNIKFDLLYLLRDQAFRKEVWPRILVWDTALAEYLLTGQDHRFPSLDDCSIKYGGTVKDSRIKEMWDAGIQTEDIDKDMLTDYLKHDLLNTELVFQKQFLEAQEAGMLPLIWSQMLALKATTEMERNGMRVDSFELNLQELSLLSDLALIKNDLQREIHKIVDGLLPDDSLNLNSNKFIGTVIYGGVVNFTTKRLSGVYKSGIKKGLDKYSNVDREIIFPTQCYGIPASIDISTKKVDEKTLTDIKKYATIVGQGIIDLLLRYRTLSKELGTYVQGIKELVYEDGCVHGNLQHTATVTGRLSSSQPNMQNITN